MIIINRSQCTSSLITLNVLFWMPDHHNIVQEFWWQTCDYKPDYPRIHKFLSFWKNEIDAVIKEIYLIDCSGAQLRNAIQVEGFNGKPN